VVEVDAVEDVPEAVPVEAALAPVDVVLEEPPQAARPKQASIRTRTAAAAGLRLRVLV
jgi:hypothetical protein